MLTYLLGYWSYMGVWAEYRCSNGIYETNAYGLTQKKLQVHLARVELNTPSQHRRGPVPQHHY
jgi:hypothetical protein